jgi:hypothetical protein
MKTLKAFCTFVAPAVAFFLFTAWRFSGLSIVAFSSSPQNPTEVEVYVFLASSSENIEQNELPENAAAVLSGVAGLLPYKSFSLLGRETFPVEAGEHRFQFQSRSGRFQIILVITDNQEGSDLQYERLTLSRLNEETWEELWQVKPEFNESEPFVVGTSRVGPQEEALVIILVKPQQVAGGEISG